MTTQPLPRLGVIDTTTVQVWPPMLRHSIQRMSTMADKAKWIYKILPHSSVDTRRIDTGKKLNWPRYTFPIPIPASHTFFLSELDYKDGFVHMSTAAQVPGTLNRFFADVPSVVLLKLETDRVGSFKRLSWDGNDGQKYPHLHAHLEGENVDSFKEVHRHSGEKGWDAALAKPEIKSWLE